MPNNSSFTKMKSIVMINQQLNDALYYVTRAKLVWSYLYCVCMMKICLIYFNGAGGV